MQHRDVKIRHKSFLRGYGQPTRRNHSTWWWWCRWWWCRWYIDPKKVILRRWWYWYCVSVVCHTFAEEVKSKLTFGYLVILSSWPFDLFYGKDDGDDDHIIWLGKCTKAQFWITCFLQGWLSVLLVTKANALMVKIVRLLLLLMVMLMLLMMMVLLLLMMMMLLLQKCSWNSGVLLCYASFPGKRTNALYCCAALIHLEKDDEDDLLYDDPVGACVAECFVLLVSFW